MGVTFMPLNAMNGNVSIDEIDYLIQIGHLSAHLNRGWNSKDNIGEYSKKYRDW